MQLCEEDWPIMVSFFTCNRLLSGCLSYVMFDSFWNLWFNTVILTNTWTLRALQTALNPELSYSLLTLGKGIFYTSDLEAGLSSHITQGYESGY